MAVRLLWKVSAKLLICRNPGFPMAFTIGWKIGRGMSRCDAYRASERCRPLSALFQGQVRFRVEVFPDWLLPLAARRRRVPAVATILPAGSARPITADEPVSCSASTGATHLRTASGGLAATCLPTFATAALAHSAPQSALTIVDGNSIRLTAI